MIDLHAKDIIGEGTARVVYRHPDDDKKCIKVAMREKLQLKKKRRGFRGLFLSLSHFDPTQSEIALIQKLERRLGDITFEYLPRFYGTVETSVGKGSVFERVGKENLQTYLKTNRFDARMESKLVAILDFFIEKGIHFSDWRASNFVVQENADQSDSKIFAVDGFEYTEFIPITRISYFSRKKMIRRSAKMITRLKSDS